MTKWIPYKYFFPIFFLLPRALPNSLNPNQLKGSLPTSSDSCPSPLSYMGQHFTSWQSLPQQILRWDSDFLQSCTSYHRKVISLQLQTDLFCKNVDSREMWSSAWISYLCKCHSITSMAWPPNFFFLATVLARVKESWWFQMKLGCFFFKCKPPSSQNKSLSKEWQRCNLPAVTMLMSLVWIGSYMGKVKPPLRNNWLWSDKSAS